MILATCVPNNFLMSFDAVKCWLALPPKYTFDFISGANIAENRNQIMRNALKDGDDLLFIDSDIIFTPEDVEKMEQHLKTYEVVTGLYPLITTESNKTVPCIFDNRGHLKAPPKEFGEIGGCGAGFLGISKEVIKKMGPSAFLQIVIEGIKFGEDLSFCHNLNERGIKIYLDPSISVGHIRLKPFYV
jgi:glycosyltransferase involved in cell wall biosynthesis